MSLLSSGGVGRVTSDVRFYGEGKAPGASAQMLFRERRINRETQEWEDGRELWVNVKSWRRGAEKLRDAGKGALIFVQGEFVTEKWTDKQMQQPREAITLHVRELELLQTGAAGSSGGFQGGSPSDGTFTPTPMPETQQPGTDPMTGGSWPEAQQPGAPQGSSTYDY